MIKRTLLAAALTVAILVWLAGSATAQPVTDAEIDAAIENGCKYLLSQQQPGGEWLPYQGYTPANTILAMLALAYAEYDVKSDAMKKGIKALLEPDCMECPTYQMAFRMQALAKLMKLVDRETRELVLARLKSDTEFICTHQGTIGGWSYNPSAASNEIGDFSNVQIAMMGLGEAVKAGLEPKAEVFLKAQKLYVEKQLPDGGWNYGRTVNDQWPWTTDQAMPSYGSMTAAGVASLYITRDYLYRGLGCPCAGGKSKYRANKVDEAIDRGLKWLGKYYDPKGNPKSTHWATYWFYSVERVGLASGIKYFGAHNWYLEGARNILSSQQKDGSWGHRLDEPSKEYPKGNYVSAPNTAWNMLFLIKGRAPVLMNKLQFEGEWNLHPQDLSTLARFVGDQKEQQFQWQVITLEAPVDEWHDSPILYITPESTFKMTDEEKKKLRKFTDDGGTILFEASCGNNAVRSWWMAVSKEIWPEYEFRKVDKDHPVWKSDIQMTKQLPGLMEMADSVRTFIFYTPSDVSCAWNTSAVTQRSEAFQFGNNIYSYSTDRAKIRSRLYRATSDKETKAEVKALMPGQRAALKVALLKHGGDWNATQRYKLLEKAAARFGVEDSNIALTVLPPALPSDAGLPSDAVMFLTGRATVSMGEGERQALAERLKGHGFLVVDAVMGDSRFNESFNAFAADMGWKINVLPDTDGLLTGTMGRATGHKLTEGLKFTFQALSTAGTVLRADLRGIYIGDKLVGIYSKRDLMYAHAGLRSFGSIGFDAASAVKVLDNILVYCTTIGEAAAKPAEPPAGAEAPPDAAKPADQPAEKSAEPAAQKPAEPAAK